MEAKDLDYIIEAHIKKARNPENRFRKWNQSVPYYIHPIWCGTMISHETSLSEEVRVAGSQALLYHDILEDTTAELPSWLTDEVKSLVLELTFTSSEDEWENIWKKSREARLFKLYDKVSNIMDSRAWMKPKRREQHLQHLRKLCEDVEKNYGELNITRLARTFF